MTVFPMHFEPWMEARGLLHELREQDGQLVARIGPVLVTLPQGLEDRLSGLIGSKIGILRTDRDFRLRIIRHTNPADESLFIIKEE
jgi:hypothetical protein